MKNFGIYDEQLGSTEPIGYIFYYEKAQSFIIELDEKLDEWQAPLLFQGLVKKGIYTIPKDIALMWVRERIIPSGRQNIGEILRNHKLKEYSEIAMLSLSKGRSSQDSCYIREVKEEEVPESITSRWKGNVVECFSTEKGDLICMFRDNTARIVHLDKLVEKYREVSHVIKYRELLESVQVGVGGYSVSFNETIEISASDLREMGEMLPLTASDFYGFVQKNVVDTTSACLMIECTRQNLSYLVKENRLKPIIQGTKENLYTKGEIARIKNE
ncbi:MAG: hypothetical protein J6B96_05635 [Agathobacter sp.]|nr:hypothetical protein [Agathobacter sp.]